MNISSAYCVKEISIHSLDHAWDEFSTIIKCEFARISSINRTDLGYYMDKSAMCLTIFTLEGSLGYVQPAA